MPDDLDVKNTARNGEDGEPSSSSGPAAPDYTGKKLGNWRLERLLGSGSFGSVYLAQNPLIEREAAVKVLHPHFAFNAGIRRRFFDEARAASKARLAEDDDRPHPGVVQIFDGDDGSQGREGLCYIVMERLSGCTLHEALRNGPLSPLFTARLGEVLADALAAVHRRGVIHRDLKPENIFLQQGDPRRPKILDFGIAKLRQGGQGTVPGTVLGTLTYMSPEQGQGLPDLDERTDLYSLGVILFECLTGCVPFAGENYHQALFQHLTAPVPDPRALAPDTPEALGRIIMDLMAKDKAARPRAEAARDGLRAVAGQLAQAPVKAPAPVPPQHAAGPLLSAPPESAPPPVPPRGAPSTLVPAPPVHRVVPLMAVAAVVPLLVVGAVVLLRTPRPKVHPPASSGSAPGPRAPPAAPAPHPPVVVPALPEGFVSQGTYAVARSQVRIGEFRRFVEAEGVTRKGPDRWPWALSHPLPADLPINNIDRDLAQRYCRWRHGERGRLPRRAELREVAARLSRGRFADLAADDDARGLLSFRCTIALPAAPPR